VEPNTKEVQAWLAIALFMLLALASGCTVGEAGDPQAKENTMRSSSVTLSMFHAPGGVYNPLFSTDGYEAALNQFVYESLVSLEDDLSFRPHLAQSWHWSMDGRDLTFTLRPDVLWQDGVPFTAEDVVFTYQALADPDYLGTRTSYVSDLVGYEAYQSGKTTCFEGVTAQGKQQVTFHFKEAIPVQLYRASFAILPQHIWEGIPLKEMKQHPNTLSAQMQIGTGPFRVASSIPNEAYVMESHESYWQGRPKLQQLIWRVVSTDVLTALLAHGEIDIVSTPQGVPPVNVPKLKDLANIRLLQTPAFSYQYLGFKLHYRPAEDVAAKLVKPASFVPNQKLNSIPLRQAMAYAINRKGMIEALLEGYAQPIHAHLPPTSWAYTAEGMNPYDYQPSLAKLLLEAHGYVDQNEDGWREQPNGAPLLIHLDVPSGNRTRMDLALVIQQNLQDVGLKVKLRAPRPVGQHYHAIEQDDPSVDLFLAGWGLSPFDPDPLSIWDSQQLWNFSRYHQPRAEALLKKAVSSGVSQADRKWLYREWQQLINKELPYLFLYTPLEIHAWNQRVKGIEESPLGIYRNPHLWEVLD
jgi:peptide/nickel transport system substrate-binding protein